MTKFTKEQRDILIKTAEYMVKRENTSEYSENIRKVAEIALAALTAEPEVWEIENPGEGTFYSAHPPRDFEKASCVYYRLPLLEGLK